MTAPPAAPAEPVGVLEAALGHRFARPALLAEALTHRSAAAPGGRGSNERLEFVGDRVLGLLIAEWLAERHPGEQEGELGARLAQLVAAPALAGVAEAVGLAAAISVAPGEIRAGVRARPSVLADAMEAVLGALYLDAGLAPARAFVRRAWAEAMAAQSAPPQDAKTLLQQWALARALPLPDYRVHERSGPDHDPRFVIEVAVGARSGRGAAGSKRAAEQAAAADLLGRLGG